MSTKIHNGYRLAADTDPFAFLPTVRLALDPVRDTLDAVLLAQDATRLIDAADLKGEPRPDRPLMAALYAYRDAQSAMDPRRYGHDPHRLEISIGRDPATGRYGLLLFADHAQIRQAVEELEQVEAYGYWNNADAPDRVTEAEWSERREFWDRIMYDDRPPSETMLTWSLRGTLNASMFDLACSHDGQLHPLVAANVPPVSERARSHAQVAVLNAAAKAGREIAHVYFTYARAGDYLEVVAAIEDVLRDLDALTLLGPAGEGPVLDAPARERIEALAEAAYLRLAAAEGDQ